MNMNRQTSRTLFEIACRSIPGGVNSPVRAFRQVGGTPVFFETAEGSRFRDPEGKEYIDFCQSWGPLILGHSRPEVVEAVREAAERGLSYGACHAREAQLAELILEGFPHFRKVRMVSSGTEAVMTALRVARGVTGRNKVLKFMGGYHGHFDGMLVKAGSGLATQAIADSKGVPQSIAATTLVTPFDDEKAVEQVFQAYGDDIAAVIIEPLPANNGLLIQRDAFLSFLRDITRRYGTLLIFDEVISGFRLRFGGYGESAGVIPDLVTLGKIIGGGMPVGAVAGPDTIMQELAPEGKVYQAGTLSGNPVSLAAGIATLKILKSENPYPRLASMGKYLGKALAESGVPYAHVQYAGSIAWLYLDDPPFPRRADMISDLAMKRFTSIYHRLLDQGFYLPPSSYEVLFISTAHTESDIGNLAEAVASALKEMEV